MLSSFAFAALLALQVPASLPASAPAAVAPAPSAVVGRPPVPSDPLAAALLDHVRVLAADGLRGREAGSPAARVAGAYIALQWLTAGIPAPPNSGRFQEFPIPAGFTVVGSPKLTLESRSVRRQLPPASFGVLPHSGSGKVTAEAVFVGYGLKRGGKNGDKDDYENLDVRGRVVLALDGGPQGVRRLGLLARKIYRAKARGAAGFVLLVGESLRPFPPAQDSSGIPAVQVPLAEAGAALSGLIRAVALYRDGEDPGPRRLGRASLAVEVRKRTGRARNVLGWIEGSDPDLKNEVVVLGAHYDHLGLGGPGSLEPGSGLGKVHNGADDNASGTAVLIEAGKALAAQRAALGRSVLLIAFSGEEKGLLGSRWFVDHPILPLDRIVAMVNLDMVGRSKKGFVAAVAAGTSPAFGEFFAEHRGGASVRPGKTSFGGSDHQSFIQKGIPAVHFFTGTHADYHKASDDFWKLNPTGMARIEETVVDLVRWLSRRKERPAFVKPIERPRPKPKAAAGDRPYLGTIPDYVEGEGGVKLNGTTPGSPAEKAGIKPGDILVELAGRKIDNIYDFSYALQDLKPGMKIKVVVLRGGKRVPLDLVVGSR